MRRRVVGRERESALLEGLLDEVVTCGAAVVLTGMAGIGKTTLLDGLRESAAARGMPILETVGLPSDADLPFAGLNRLVRPILAGLTDLPAPQRRAVEAAFGSSGEHDPQPFLIALGVLGLLGTAAAGSPMLILVEDAHWLDRPSADVLAFAGRRLDADPIVLAVAAREGYDSPFLTGLPDLHLEPLTEQAAAELVDSNRPGLPPAARDRVLAEAEGNPLALCELTATLDSTRLPGMSVPRRVEQAFAARAAELPASARTAVLVAAAAGDAPLTTILTAAARLDGAPRTIDDLVPAERARLITIEGGRVRFRHPLVGSAIYQAAPVADRNDVHSTLADLFHDDPDRRIWHRWAASTGPDPALAAEAEEAGHRALRRGAVATAVIAFERAAAMEIDTARRGRLLLEAASVANDLGDNDTAMRLLSEAGALGLDRRGQARVMWLEDSLRPGVVGDPGRIRRMVAAASDMARLGDRDLALGLLIAAAARCNWAGLGAEGHRVVRAADQVGADPDDPRLLHIQVFAAPLDRGAAVLREVDRSPTPTDPMTLFLQGVTLCMAGAFNRAEPLLGAAAAQLRRQGRLRQLAQVLPMRAWAAALTGDFTVAVPSAEEARRLVVETEEPFWRTNALVARSLVAAIRGDQDTVEVLTAEADRIAGPAGAALLLALALYARGFLELGRGRHAEAYEHLRRLHEPGDPAHHLLVAHNTAGEFIEAAVHSGHRAEALAYLRDCEPLARVAQSPLFDLQLLFGSVHLAEDEDVFADALSRDLSSWPLFRARIELAYGEWLRRRRRQLASRVPLRAARDAFDAVGATPLAERARQELRAAGEGSPERAPGSLDHLTPQQFQIVQMVAAGLTNGDIAERLYLSRRTVESHLYRVFPKLGVSSRNQLVKALETEFRWTAHDRS